MKKTRKKANKEEKIKMTWKKGIWKDKENEKRGREKRREKEDEEERE